MASSKTLFSPFCVNAEHSRYLMGTRNEYPEKELRTTKTKRHVPNRANLFRQRHCFRVLYGHHSPIPQLGNHFWILSQIQLCADQQDRYIWGVVIYFGQPLRHRPSFFNKIQLSRVKRPLLTLPFTFSKLGGLTRLKQMRNTSVCGYDSGRSRS